MLFRVWQSILLKLFERLVTLLSGRVIIYDEGRYTITPEVKEKLLKSQQDAENAVKKIIYCPICGARLIELYSDDRPIIQTKCRKCKLEQPINTVYFRRAKSRY